MADLTEAQDALRPVRQFVGLLSGMVAVADNTYASEDYYPYNAPRAYQTIGPYGASVEGTTASIITTTSNGGVVISPMLILIGVGFAAAMLWKH